MITSEGTPLGDLMRAIRHKRVGPFVGKGIGHYIQSSGLEEDVNFLSGMTKRYAARTYKRMFAPDFGSISDLIA